MLVVELVDLVKIVRILKMEIDEIHLKAAGESVDSAAIARVKEGDPVLHMGDPERTVKNPTTPRMFSRVERRVRMSPRAHSHLCIERTLSSLCQPHPHKSMPGTRGKQRLSKNQATQLMESHHHRAIPKSLQRVNLSQILHQQGKRGISR